jgi:hypothetical protein
LKILSILKMNLNDPSYTSDDKLCILAEQIVHKLKTTIEKKIQVNHLVFFIYKSINFTNTLDWLNTPLRIKQKKVPLKKVNNLN